MTKPAADYFKQFRSAEEIRRDEAWEDHLNYECNNADCEYCKRDMDDIYAFVDQELYEVQKMIQSIQVKVEVVEPNKNRYMDLVYEIPLEADARDVAKYLNKVKTRVIELQDIAKKQDMED